MDCLKTIPLLHFWQLHTRILLLCTYTITDDVISARHSKVQTYICIQMAGSHFTWRVVLSWSSRTDLPLICVCRVIVWALVACLWHQCVVSYSTDELAIPWSGRVLPAGMDKCSVQETCRIGVHHGWWWCDIARGTVERLVIVCQSLAGIYYKWLLG